MSGQTVAAILTTLNNNFSGGMIQSLKEYLMALNNSFDKFVDSVTARTPPGRDDIDGESLSGPDDSVTQIHFRSEHLTTEDSQMDGTLPVYNDLVHNMETEDTQAQQGGEVMSCTYYPPYSMDDLFDHITLFIADPCVWDCEGLSFKNCPQRRDLSKEPAQVCPVSFNDLKTLKSFVGINQEESCIIIPVLYSRRCDVFVFFKSLVMSDGVHLNTLVSIVFGPETNKRVMPHLKSVLRGSGIDVNDRFKHIILNTEDYPSVIRKTYIHTLFTIRYLYLYSVCSFHEVRAGILFDNIEKWVEAVFLTEDDSDIKGGRERDFVENFLPNDTRTDKILTDGIEEDDTCSG